MLQPVTSDGPAAPGSAERESQVLIALEPGPSVDTKSVSVAVPPQGLAGRLPLDAVIVLIGRDAKAEICLDHPLVARRHATIVRDGAQVRLRDLGSRSGTYLNGRRIDSAELDQGDVVQIGPFTARWLGNRFEAVDPASTRALRIDAIGVEYRPPVGFSFIREPQLGQRLLANIDISIQPGEFVAIVGGSGAGKSTLLRVLAGLRHPTKGVVRYNGLDISMHRSAFRRSVGYVPQDDIVHPGLTVEEALTYTARLRFSPDHSTSQLHERVFEALDAVDLVAQRDNVVANLSGGQRKRVSIAAELLSEPSALLLDEPTSGLDSGLDKRLMLLLRRLSDRGTTVIAVTHTPEHLDLCDTVVFLGSGGEVAFSGPPHLVLRFFGQTDMAEVYSALDDENSTSWWSHRFRDSTLYQEYVLLRRGRSPSDASAVAEGRVSGQHVRPDLVRQSQTLLKRQAVLMARDRVNLAILLLQAPIIASLLAVVSGPHPFVIPTSTVDILNPPGVQTMTLVFVLACMVVWLGLLNSVRELVKDRAVAARERMVGVSALAQFVSMLVALSTLGAVQILSILIIIGVARGFPAHGLVTVPALELGISLALALLSGLGIGLAISAAAPTSDRALSLAPYVLIPQVLLAGILFDLGNAGAVSLLVSSRWAVAALGGTAGLAHAYLSSSWLYAESRDGILGDWGALGVLSLVSLVLAYLLERRHTL